MASLGANCILILFLLLQGPLRGAVEQCDDFTFIVMKVCRSFRR